MKTPEFLKKTVVNKRSPYFPSRRTKPNDGFVYQVYGMDDGSYIRVGNPQTDFVNKSLLNLYLRLEDSLTFAFNTDTSVRIIGKIKTIEIELDE